MAWCKARTTVAWLEAGRAAYCLPTGFCHMLEHSVGCRSLSITEHCRAQETVQKTCEDNASMNSGRNCRRTLSSGGHHRELYSTASLFTLSLPLVRQVPRDGVGDRPACLFLCH